MARIEEIKGKSKLVLIPEKENRERIKIAIIKFIDNRWIRNKDIFQSDILAVFQKPPYNLSSGTTRNILDELIKERKISTWKQGLNRYYSPPKLPISLKFGGAFAAILVSATIFIDIFFNSEVILSQLFSRMISLTIYSLILIAIFTIFSYNIEKKKNYINK